MKPIEKISFFERIKRTFIGEARNPLDQATMHNISLVAFFAWVGLGADGLSSSCYGPEEIFVTLGKHHFLGLIVALATAATIIIISASYSQIIELFPGGGGGYFVASKLLSPTIGMVSGCALLIDYVLTITISIASGADAFFSFLPPQWIAFKIFFALTMLFVLIVLNLRGVKESVTILMPIFLIFVVTHALVIIYALWTHFQNFPQVVSSTRSDISGSVAELGIFGVLFLMMRAYSMGAGTYTGIEAVSNGLPILREPRVKTAKATMRYMYISLSAIVLGLMFAYTLYSVEPQFGKTLNAVLFEKVTFGFGLSGVIFVLVALISEAAILFVAAQAGFLDGPRVLSNMATDRWVPKRFALLSDRLVTMNGIMIMGVGAAVLLALTGGSVRFLIVLYSINVFITFCLSQTGMVRHWWEERSRGGAWISKIILNGIGLTLTSFILIMMIVMKFDEGGWITLAITGTLIVFMLLIKRIYESTDKQVKQLDAIVNLVESTQLIPQITPCSDTVCKYDPNDRTAVILVKDFTGVGIKTIFSIFRSFGNTFKNFIFVQVGLIDAGAFRSHEDMEKVKNKVENEVHRYIDLMKKYGYHAEGFGLFGTDTVEEIANVSAQILKRYPNATFFGGQIVFPNNAFVSKILHNYTLFSMQDRLYKEGVPLFILPIELTPQVRD